MIEVLEEMQRAISIHAPREGGDLPRGKQIRRTDEFQSTPPARGATNFLRDVRERVWISIHAPREGGDQTWTSNIL